MITIMIEKFLQLTFSFILVSLCIKTASVISSESVADHVKVKNCLERERRALLIFKDGLIDEYGRLSSWGSEDDKEDCCKWKGIHCNNRTGHVIGLNLRGTSSVDYPEMPLRGYLTSSLLELNYLNYLDMSFNDFGGKQIPDFVGFLDKLRYLNLSYSGFSGRVPYQLGNLSGLQYLDLSGNFYGLFADKLEWLWHLSSLRHVRLNNVNLTEAKDWLHVVSELSFLTKLELQGCDLQSVCSSSISLANSSKSLAFLDLSQNNLSNSIYFCLSNISRSLVHLDLSSNNFQGPIPDYAFLNMTSLMYLYLDENQIDGIPESFRNLCSLKRLSILFNNLTGKLSELFLNLSGCTKDTLESLILQDNMLSGSLPDFTLFPSLRELDLSSNKLNGSFPKRFAQLSNLTKFDVAQNQLGGSLPDFSLFLSLKIFSIYNNRLNGTFGRIIGQLPKLEHLDASSNSLEDMITEIHMSNLFKLKFLDLSFNKLTLNFSSGWIPPFQLDMLRLSTCVMGPRFPKWLHTLNMLSELDLSNAGISDIIPNWFWDLSPNLYFLNLSHNCMSGVLPDLSLKFAGYPGIDLSFNCFEGPIPPVPPNVTSLILSNNMFSGSISFLCATTGEYFSYLDLSDNWLSGELPSCWTPWQTLTILNLANNNFSGLIPNSMTSGCYMRSLHLRNNSMSGELPTSLKNCKELTVLDVGNNDFSGTLPAWISDSLLDLAILSLRSNQFSGTVPRQLCNLEKLQVLDLSGNNISGTIPECLTNLTTMVQKESSNPFISYGFPLGSPGDNNPFPGSEYQDHALLVWKGIDSEYRNTLGLVKSIDLSSNKLSGVFPEALTSLIGLISLNLSRNGLTGPIPPKIGQLNLLNTLDLSKNLLTGQIPESFSQMNSLGVLNMLDNNLSGKIPSNTKLQSFDTSAFLGNPELCGAPLPNKCPEEEPAQDPAVITHDQNEDEIITPGFYISIAIGFIVGFWGVVGTLLLNRSWRHAYFQFLNHTKDRLYVAMVLNIAKLRRRLRS